MKKITSIVLVLLLLSGLAVLPAQAAVKPLVVSFIDVGQGDSELIRCPGGQTVLVDCGDGAHAAAVVSFLKTRKIKQIDVLVLTHPHEDHIGGAPDVVKTIPIKRVCMPKIVHSSDVYIETLQAINKRKIPVTWAKTGAKLNIPGIDAQLLGPTKRYDDNLNDNSAVLKITYQNHSILFAGDASEVAEADMLNAGVDLRAEILKVGHHGIATSSSNDFLRKVKPKYAIAEVGAGNDYGHPKPSALARLRNVGATIYRTDMNGTVTVTVDTGIKISTEKKSSAVQERAPTATTSIIAPSSGGNYIGNIHSHVFHRTACGSLPLPENQIRFSTRQEAIAAGYVPCKLCLGK